MHDAGRVHLHPMLVMREKKMSRQDQYSVHFVICAHVSMCSHVLV